jgi:hypothetical protein
MAWVDGTRGKGGPMLRVGSKTGPIGAATRGVGRRLAAGLVAGSLLVAGLATTGRAAVSQDADPAVIRDWNATAVATIVVDAGKANAEAFLWYGFVQAAVYNAVVGITREYELYEWNKRGPHAASPEAAAAAAAHRLLSYYFPASQARLDTQLAASLAGVADGSAKQQGIVYGEAAANHIIDLRKDDGRNATVPYEAAPGPGVWRPTPPTNTPFFAPWLGQVDPLLIDSPTQFRPGPPPGLTSDEYTTDFAEVKAFGSKLGSLRTDKQTETALFFSDTGIGPFQAALRDLTARRGMDISGTARLFAAVNMSVADAFIAVWDAKLHYAYWRPITAIHLADTDDNPDTTEDTAWEPLIPTPPYPDYVSGLTANVGAVSRSLSRLLGGGQVDLYITSPAAGVTRHYTTASVFNRDAINARVWSGIHFRTADEVGNEMAAEIADWGLDHYFQPA